MWWDSAGFSLTLHGDTYERESWGSCQHLLSGYESVWRKYVVPLTNRIDSRISPKDDESEGSSRKSEAVSRMDAQ